MREYFKYFHNMSVTAIFSVTLSALVMSGCSYFKQSNDLKSNELKQGAQSQKSEDKDIGKGSKEDDKIKEIEEDYSTAAYYYYMKSEKEKQNNNIPTAIDALNQAITIDPDSIYLKKSMVFLHILNKDNENAANVAQELNRAKPNDEAILSLLAKLKLQIDKVDEAKALYRQIINLNPKNHDAYILLGNLYMNSSETGEAFNLFSEMVKQFPDSHGAHFFMGQIFAQKKSFDLAEKEFFKSIELKNDFVEPRFELIGIYKSQLKDELVKTKKGKKGQKEKIQKIISLYDEILEIDSNNIKAAIELPLYLYKNGDKAKASQILADFGQRYQNDDDMMMLMAKELVNADNKDDAIIVFNELLKESSDANSDKSAIHYLAGLTFDALKDSQKAIFHFLQVSSKSDQYRKSLFHVAYIYSQLDQRDRSIDFLESKLADFSADSEFISYLAAFYEEDNQLNKALEMLQLALKDSPDDTELLFRLGVIFDKSGDKDECIATMKRVVELDDQHASALNYLGYTYAELEINLDEAEELIKKALSIKPDDGYITDSLGWVYYKKGDYDKAIEILEKASQLSSEDPVIVEHLADAYKEKKMYEKALDGYKKALLKNTNPDNKKALEDKIGEIEALIKTGGVVK
ncbi:MAG: tetratricopeptide repeat protein [Desulfamplus sp.]|nr:tetratricopeptide repeat protein [Desulfamplus sp.]